MEDFQQKKQNKIKRIKEIISHETDYFETDNNFVEECIFQE